MRALEVVGFAGMFVLLACGSDGERARTVPRNKQVNELSERENEQLCRAIAAHWKEVELATFEAGCISAVLETASCEADREDCIERATDADTAERCSESADQITGGEACEVTVEQLEACFEALADASREFADEVTCDKRVEQIVPLAPPKACTNIAPRCQPAIFFTGG